MNGTPVIQVQLTRLLFYALGRVARKRRLPRYGLAVRLLPEVTQGLLRNASSALERTPLIPEYTGLPYLQIRNICAYP